MPWVPLCRQEGPPEQTLRRCQEIIDRKARPEEVSNLLAITQVLARLRYNDPGVFEILGGRKMMMESPLIQEIVAAAQEKERVETTQRDILRFLAGRFGPVPFNLEERLGWIRDEHRLESLIDEAARCMSLGSFRTQLD